MRKHKFTWIDLVVLIIVLVAIISMKSKLDKANIAKSEVQKKDIEISFYIESVPETVLNGIKIDSPVRESVQGSSFGKITKIEKGPSVVFASDDEGNVVSSEKEGYISLTITMKASGEVKPNGISLDKSVYYVGQTVTLYAGNSILKDGRISYANTINE
ncbi:MAG: DUF4330 domain-containing protein [Tissierellales bacterium]|nr:DUF4330 domain-containing protein [Tissierellales bacterium]